MDKPPLPIRASFAATERRDASVTHIKVTGPRKNFRFGIDGLDA